MSLLFTHWAFKFQVKLNSYDCERGLTGVVAIGACVRPLALAEAPHGALVWVNTFFIDGIYVVLGRPQGPNGFLTVLTTVGATRACREKIYIYIYM